MSHSLTIDEIVSIENLNHPRDFQIYFRGGSVTFNAANGPLRFWHDGELICLETEEDVKKLQTSLLRKKISEKNEMIDEYEPLR